MPQITELHLTREWLRLGQHALLQLAAYDRPCGEVPFQVTSRVELPDHWQDLSLDQAGLLLEPLVWALLERRAPLTTAQGWTMAEHLGAQSATLAPSITPEGILLGIAWRHMPQPRPGLVLKA